MKASSASSSPHKPTSPAMCALSLLFLLLLAGALHLHDSDGLHPAVNYCLWGMLGLYPAFWMEGLLSYRAGSPRKKQIALCCLLPPLRLGARDHASGRTVWLPRRGWVTVDDRLRQSLQKSFSLPMILMALMVLPLIAVEHFWSERIAEDRTLGMLVQGATALIWFAFTFEFIVMISLVERKWQYAREHWIDVLVILLPLVAFLRAARLGRLMRLQQLSRTARVYRLRGLLTRTYRALLLLEVVERMLSPHPEKRRAQIAALIPVKEQELAELRRELAELDEALEASPVRSHEAA